MPRTTSRIAALVSAGAVALLAACGGSDGATSPSSSSTTLTQQQAQTVSVSLFNEIAKALAQISFSRSPSPGLSLNMTPTSTISSTCSGGGQITGSVTFTDGTNNAGTGVVSGSETIVLKNCGVSTGNSVIAVNGNVSVTFSESFVNGNQSSDFTFQESGQFTWPGASCSFQLNARITAQGKGSLSGTMCGESVSATF